MAKGFAVETGARLPFSVFMNLIKKTISGSLFFEEKVFISWTQNINKALYNLYFCPAFFAKFLQSYQHFDSAYCSFHARDAIKNLKRFFSFSCFCVWAYKCKWLKLKLFKNLIFFWQILKATPFKWFSSNASFNAFSLFHGATILFFLLNVLLNKSNVCQKWKMNWAAYCLGLSLLKS